MHRYLFALALCCASNCFPSLVTYLTKPVILKVTEESAPIEIPKQLAFLSDVIEKAFFKIFDIQGIEVPIVLPALESDDLAHYIVQLLTHISTFLEAHIDHRALHNFLLRNPLVQDVTFWDSTDPVTRVITQYFAEVLLNTSQTEMLAVLNAGKEPLDFITTLNFTDLTQAQLNNLLQAPGIFKEVVHKAAGKLQKIIAAELEKTLLAQHIDPFLLLNAAQALEFQVIAHATASYIGKHLPELLSSLPHNEQGLPTLGTLSPALAKKIKFVVTREHPHVFFPLWYTVKAATALPITGETLKICTHIQATPCAIAKSGTLALWPELLSPPMMHTLDIPKQSGRTLLTRVTHSPQYDWLATTIRGHGIDIYNPDASGQLKHHMWINYLWGTINTQGIFACETDGHSIIIDAKHQQPLGRISGNCPCFNKQGTILATTDWETDKTTLWNSENLQCIRTIPKTLHHLNDVEPFSDDGSLIGTIRNNREVHIYTITGLFRFVCDLKHTFDLPVQVKHYTFSPQNNYIAVTFVIGQGRRAKSDVSIWHIPTKKRIASFPGSEFGAWTPGETHLILRSPHYTLNILPLNTTTDASAQPIHLKAHINDITAVQCLGTQGRIFATSSKDNTTRIWHTASGDLLYTLLHEHPVYGLCAIPAAQQLVSMQKHELDIWPLTQLDVPSALTLDQILAALTLALAPKDVPQTLREQVAATLQTSTAGTALFIKLTTPQREKVTGQAHI